MQAILHNYRTTPHATTGVAPAVLLLKRPVRNKLPQANHIDPVAEIVRERDSSQKLKMKAHADNKAYVKPCNISPGESVLVKRPFSVSKGGTVYDLIPMTVVSKKGSMITAEGENHTLSQEIHHFSRMCTNPLLATDMMSLRTVTLALQLIRNHHPLLIVQTFLVQVHQNLSTP